MLYLSKGIICTDRTNDIITVARGNRTINFKGIEAELWLRGRFGFSKTHNQSEASALKRLEELELIECESDDTPDRRYAILTRCVCCVARIKPIRVPLGLSEKNIITWLSKAGLRLTTAELVYLVENNVKPDESLLYEHNRQALVERIYTTNTIADNILENQMKFASCRDKVIDLILSLLKKKRLVIL